MWSSERPEGDLASRRASRGRPMRPRAVTSRGRSGVKHPGTVPLIGGLRQGSVGGQQRRRRSGDRPEGGLRRADRGVNRGDGRERLGCRWGAQPVRAYQPPGVRRGCRHRRGARHWRPAWAALARSMALFDTHHGGVRTTAAVAPGKVLLALRGRVLARPGRDVAAGAAGAAGFAGGVRWWRRADGRAGGTGGQRGGAAGSQGRRHGRRGGAQVHKRGSWVPSAAGAIGWAGAAAGAAPGAGVGKPSVVPGLASNSGAASRTTARRQMTLPCSMSGQYSDDVKSAGRHRGSFQELAVSGVFIVFTVRSKAFIGGRRVREKAAGTDNRVRT